VRLHRRWLARRIGEDKARVAEHAQTRRKIRHHLAELDSTIAAG
jgi:hypothetical protein